MPKECEVEFVLLRENFRMICEPLALDSCYIKYFQFPVHERKLKDPPLFNINHWTNVSFNIYFSYFVYLHYATLKDF